MPFFTGLCCFPGLSEDKLFEVAQNFISRKSLTRWFGEDSYPKELPSQAIKSLSEVSNFQITFIEAGATVITPRFDFFFF